MPTDHIIATDPTQPARGYRVCEHALCEVVVGYTDDPPLWYQRKFCSRHNTNEKRKQAFDEAAR